MQVLGKEKTLSLVHVSRERERGAACWRRPTMCRGGESEDAGAARSYKHTLSHIHYSRTGQWTLGDATHAATGAASTPASPAASTSTSASTPVLDQLDRFQDVCFVGLNNLTIHHHLLHYKMRLFEIEHNVQLAHVLKVFVQRLHQRVDKLQDSKLVL